MSFDLPPAMRGWVFTSRGSPASIFRLRADLPIPSPHSLAANEVFIRISHVALNPGMAVLFHLVPHFTSAPWIPEFECSGTVVAIGSSVTHVKPADEVFAAEMLPSFFKYGGALVEYLKIPAELVVCKPQTLSMAEAAGLSAVGCTAIQAADVAGLKQGDKVFINGGSGGLGSMMVQVANTIVGESGQVVATCSGPNVEMVKSMGADEVIDYTVHTSIARYLAGKYSSTPFNAIIDSVWSQVLYTDSPSYLTVNGKYVTLGGMSVAKNPSVVKFGTWLLGQVANRYLPVMLGGIPRAYLFYSATIDRKSMLKVKELVESGKVKSVVDSVWKMEEALKAYERMESQRARGKILIQVQ